MRMCASPTARRPSSGCSSGFTRKRKTEEVYWKVYVSSGDARASLAVFHQRYNEVQETLTWRWFRPKSAILSRLPTFTLMARPWGCRSGTDGHKRRGII